MSLSLSLLLTIAISCLMRTSKLGTALIIKLERVRERLLRDGELTLDKALELCRINEKSEGKRKY